MLVLPNLISTFPRRKECNTTSKCKAKLYLWSKTVIHIQIFAKTGIYAHAGVWGTKQEFAYTPGGGRYIYMYIYICTRRISGHLLLPPKIFTQPHSRSHPQAHLRPQDPWNHKRTQKRRERWRTYIKTPVIVYTHFTAGLFSVLLSASQRMVPLSPDGKWGRPSAAALLLLRYGFPRTSEVPYTQEHKQKNRHTPP